MQDVIPSHVGSRHVGSQVMWGQVLFLDILSRVNEIWRDQDQQDSNFSNLPPKNLSRMTHY